MTSDCPRSVPGNPCSRAEAYPPPGESSGGCTDEAEPRRPAFSISAHQGEIADMRSSREAASHTAHPCSAAPPTTKPPALRPSISAQNSVTASIARITHLVIGKSNGHESSPSSTASSSVRRIHAPAFRLSAEDRFGTCPSNATTASHPAASLAADASQNSAGSPSRTGALSPAPSPERNSSTPGCETRSGTITESRCFQTRSRHRCEVSRRRWIVQPLSRALRSSSQSYA